MSIESIRSKKLPGFQNTKAERLPDMAVLLDVNGTGKTISFDDFGFVRDTS